jgi:hypothetical protein
MQSEEDVGQKPLSLLSATSGGFLNNNNWESLVVSPPQTSQTIAYSWHSLFSEELSRRRMADKTPSAVHVRFLVQLGRLLATGNPGHPL